MSRVINPFAFSSQQVNAGSRDFELDNSEYFTRAIASAVNPGDSDFWFSAWVKFETVPSGSGHNRGIAGAWTTGGDRCWLINAADITGSKAFFRVLLRNAADSGNTGFDHSATLTNSTWCLVTFYHDAANNEVGIAKDDGAFETTAYSSGVNTGTITPFQIGWTNSAGIGEYMDGLLRNVCMGQIPSGTMNTLAATIRDALYNSGNALNWEDLTSTQKTDWGLTSGNGVWYPMNEENVGDDAVDNVASLNATDTNTVGVSSDVP